MNNFNLVQNVSELVRHLPGIHRLRKCLGTIWLSPFQNELSQFQRILFCRLHSFEKFGKAYRKICEFCHRILLGRWHILELAQSWLEMFNLL